MNAGLSTLFTSLAAVAAAAMLALTLADQIQEPEPVATLAQANVAEQTQPLTPEQVPPPRSVE